MILTITMNPAIDKSASTGKLIPEKKLRCCDMCVEPGGGGLTLAKPFKNWGAKAPHFSQAAAQTENCWSKCCKHKIFH